MNLILKSEAKGREEGRAEGCEEGMVKQFKSLIQHGVEKEQALKSVSEDYPQYSQSTIRKILSV